MAGATQDIHAPPHLQHWCSWDGFARYFGYYLRGKRGSVHPPGLGPVPVGNSVPTQHNNSFAFLPNIYPGEAPAVAQESVPICLE